MTCVLSSPWQPFSASYEWSPISSMHPVGDIAGGSGYDGHQQGYVSSESESKPTSNSSGKKRASRAGTRSVTTLSAAQLERKRANDREAQRAIRQRTKEHIDTLERSINDLRASQEASEKVIAVTQQRNRELEDENAYLKTRLNEVGFPVNPLPNGNQETAHPLQAASAVTQVSGPGMHRSSSDSTTQSALSLAQSQASGPRHGSWQQTQGDIPLNVPGPAPVGPNVTAWRPQEGSHGAQDPSQGFQQPQYNVGPSNDRPQWPGAPQAYQLPDQQPPVEQPPQTQQPYPPPPVSHYAGPPGPQPPVYQSPTAPNHAQYQNIAVTSPTSYSVPQQQPFTQYPMAPMQVSSAPTSAVYASQPGPMEPQPHSAPHFHAPPAEQHYQQTPMHQPIPFRQDSGGRSYSLTHYPAG